MNDRTFRIAATAVVLLAAVLRFDGLAGGLPNPHTRPDELPVVLEMARPARGVFELKMLVYPNAYVYVTWLWVEAGLRVAPLFGVDPPGGLQRTLLQAPEDLFLIGRAFSATAGTLTVLLLISLVRREWGSAEAIAAGALLATCFLQAKDSHALKPDALLTLTSLLALALAVPLARNATPRRAFAAGLGAGLAMASKYTGLLALAPLYVAAMLGTAGRGWRRLLAPPAILGGLVAAAVFVSTSPLMVFSGPFVAWVQLTLSVQLPDLVSPPEAPELVRTADMVARFPPPPGMELERFEDQPWFRGLLFHSRLSLWYGIGAIATLLAPLAIVWGFASRHPLGILAAVACVVQYLVMGATPVVSSRYITQLLPMLLLLEVGMITAAARRFVPRHAGLALAVVCALVSAQPLLAILGHNRIVSQTDTRVLATRWLEENVSKNLGGDGAKGERITYEGSVFMPYGRPVPPRGAVVVTAGLDAAELSAKGIDYLVTHEHPLSFSTLDAAAMDTLAPHLTLVADFDPRAGGDPEVEAIFEDVDAYYVPFHGFASVARPGPHVRIYAVGR